MDIQRFTWDIIDSNSWLITEGNNGLLIDAVNNNLLFKRVTRISKLSVILTHSHFDHISGLNGIRAIKQDAVVIATEKCSNYLGNVYRNMSSTATAFMAFYEAGKHRNALIEPFTCKPAEMTFSEKIEIDWCGHNVMLMAVYGHSDDSLIAIVDNIYLFSGDTLLSVPTITRFPTGSNVRFWEEDVPKIKTLKDVQLVYPGHGKEATFEKMISANNMQMMHGAPIRR